MERIINQQYAETIGYAFELIGQRLTEMLAHVHFCCGVDPFWIGLESGSKKTQDGRSYRNTAHVCYPWHLKNKHDTTTVVLPCEKPVYTIIHELGHCLDEVLRFEHEAKPVNKYAQLNRGEAFAEAFAANWFWLGEKANNIWLSDEATQALFGELGCN